MVVQLPKERILDGPEVQSLVPIHRGFSLFGFPWWCYFCQIELCGLMMRPPLLGSIQKQQTFEGIGVLWSGYKGILEEFCIKSLACTKCWCLNWRLFLDLVSCYYVMLKFDFPFITFIIRIILPKKTLFIETLQLVTSLLAVTIGWKCLTLGWCDKSMKMWIAQESVRNFPSNGWLQNHFIKAPLPSRVMCE